MALQNAFFSTRLLPLYTGACYVNSYPRYNRFFSLRVQQQEESSISYLTLHDQIQTSSQNQAFLLKSSMGNHGDKWGSKRLKRHIKKNLLSRERIAYKEKTMEQCYSNERVQPGQTPCVVVHETHRGGIDTMVPKTKASILKLLEENI